MFSNNTAISIDIGSRTIKAVHGKITKDSVSIIDYGIYDTPKNTFMDGSIIDKMSIVKSISGLMAGKNFKSKNVIMAVKGNDVITRHIEMPIMSDKQLKQAVKLEIQQYLPMDPNEYVIDSKTIDKVDTKDKKVYNVLLVAAPKRKIEDYFFIADKLQLKVKAIDLFANSVTRLFPQKVSTKSDTAKSSCACMLDLGHESTNIMMIEDGKLFMERDISVGIKHINSMVRTIFAADSEEIESIRNEKICLTSYESSGSEDPRIYYANNKAREIVEGLIDGIIKVFDFYTSSGFGKTIGCIYIYGGGSRLNGITDYIKNSINVDVKPFDIELLSNIKNISDSFKKDLVFYINCLSLLLWKE